jgi:hypothetical protein
MQKLPRLGTDGRTVAFDSYNQFRDHHRDYIRYGGLLVEAPPLDVGTRRKLALTISEISVTHQVDAFVVYRTPNAVGFVIEGFQEIKTRLRSLAED